MSNRDTRVMSESGRYSAVCSTSVPVPFSFLIHANVGDSCFYVNIFQLCSILFCVCVCVCFRHKVHACMSFY